LSAPGISGIGAAIQLKADGVNDILILERDNDVGGTWRDNRYPGIAVDITSVTYSFSFEQNANWVTSVRSGQRAVSIHPAGVIQIWHLPPYPLRR
jgi:cation diffusion facilitator CzcD-associated flavoprotein CzcO